VPGSRVTILGNLAAIFGFSIFKFVLIKIYFSGKIYKKKFNFVSAMFKEIKNINKNEDNF